MPSETGSASDALAALATSYLRPWRGGIPQEAVDEAHLHWADYRDTQWGGSVPLGVSHNRLLRINIISGRLYYYTCVAQRGSEKRLRRQNAALRLMQAVLDAHPLPDLDLVLSLSDRPTVPRRAIGPGQLPPPVFAYARTPRHHAILFPYMTFDPKPWAALHSRLGMHAPLRQRSPTVLWRGSCNSLCDMMRRTCRLPKDSDLLPRQLLLHVASRCPAVADVGVVSSHRYQTWALTQGRRPLPLSPSPIALSLTSPQFDHPTVSR